MELANLLVQTEEIYSPFFAQVFKNPLLLEEILNHAIKKTVTKDYSNRVYCYSKQNIYNFRLVSKSWLNSISKIVKRKKSALTKLGLLVGARQNQTNITKQVVRNKCKVKRALNLFSSSHHLAHISVIPFDLTVSKVIMDDVPYAVFDLLKICGQNLSIFKVELGKNMQLALLDSYLPLFLPNLLYFGLYWPGQAFKNWTEEKESMQNDNNNETFVQAILDGSKRLQRIFFSCSLGVSRNLRNLRLPSTILDVTLCTPELDLLIYSQLPFLQKLFVHIILKEGQPPIDRELISGILDKYRETLVYFNLECYGLTPSVKLPVMKKLNHFRIQSNDCIWGSSNSNIDFEKCLPVLKNLTLNVEKESSWVQWLGNGHNLEKVLSLRIMKRWSSTQMEMKMIIKTFPNLQSLYIFVNFNELQVLFRGMPQLRRLTLLFGEGLKKDYITWNCKFLGITSEQFMRSCAEVGAQKNPGNSGLMDFKMKTNELTQLKMVYKTKDPVQIWFPVLVFHMGLMKMRNLKKLEIVGGIKLTARMIDLWTMEHQGTIKYSKH